MNASRQNAKHAGSVALKGIKDFYYLQNFVEQNHQKVADISKILGAISKLTFGSFPSLPWQEQIKTFIKVHLASKTILRTSFVPSQNKTGMAHAES